MNKAILKVLTFCFGLFIFTTATSSIAQPAVPPTPQDGATWRRFSNNNGPLSAEMFIISKAQLEEFEKPSNEVVNLTPLVEAHVGDIVAIKVLFNGAGVSPTNTFDVTYDIRFVAPNGELYDDFHKENMPAYIGPTANLDAIYDNIMSIPHIRFEPHDAAGAYRVEVTLRDNVSGRKIGMTKSITLIK